MAKPRLYLFHGNDTRTSLLDVNRWRQAFAQKYDSSGLTTLDADELDVRSLSTHIKSNISTHSLFAEPRFTVIRRLSSLTPAQQKEALQVIDEAVAHLSDGSVLVVWEDKMLKDSAPILQWAAKRADKQSAEVKLYQVSDGRYLIDKALRQGGYTLSPDARYWLLAWARNAERVQRVESRLKATEQIAADRRVWEIPSTIEIAALLTADTKPIEVKQLEQAVVLSQQAVSPFEIVNAVQAHDWLKAQRLACQWSGDDDRAYYGLAALLRMHFSREQGGRNSDLGTYGLQLLAEIELASKNIGARLPWLFDLLFQRCAQFSLHGDAPLLSPRRMWLSHVQRLS